MLYLQGYRSVTSVKLSRLVGLPYLPAVSIFLDLSKAFDTVNHSILLSKLDLYGIRGNKNQWFRFYLSNRKQKVFVNGVESKFLLVNSGVPQGSILGRFLFLIYMDDFEKATNYFC